MLSRMKALSVCILFFILFSACTTMPPEQTATFSPEVEITFSPQPTFTEAPTATLTPTSTEPIRQSQVCSPLQGETLAELPDIITQPFKMPRIGHDEPHHGVDFAFYRRKELLSVDGLPVLSALDGEVVTIINDRYPYGYSVIIETSLDSISQELLQKISIPDVQPTMIPDPKFLWKPVEFPFILSETDRSLYILYSHLKYPTDLKVGDKVICGSQIGFVGNTGDSSNPHLHFETRVGPSGARFESMAYYITQSTETERYNYLVWRVTNLFQLFDPMILLSADK